jgi:hypothetical protein
MTKPKRQFDRSKYLNNPRALTGEQHARLQLAREKARRLRPSVFWLRAAAWLTLDLLVLALVGLLADWSILRTGLLVVVCVILWAAVNILAWRDMRRGPGAP